MSLFCLNPLPVATDVLVILQYKDNSLTTWPKQFVDTLEYVQVIFDSF